MLHAKTGPWMFKGENANEFYDDMLATIRLEGERSAPRGLPTTELLHAVTRIENPRQRVLTIPGRNLNPFFNLAEALWILHGQSEAKWILPFNSKLEQFLDPPRTHFHGAYGERIRKWPRVTRMSHKTGQDIVLVDQLYNAYQTLYNDLASRQAVIVLWNPWVDGPATVSNDRPCNDAIALKIRRGKLYMSVFNRSNDVILGLTSTNIVQFSTLQEVLASWLGVDVGGYTHYSDSLHLYDSQEAGAAYKGTFNVYDYVAPTPMLSRLPEQSDEMFAKLYKLIWHRLSTKDEAALCDDICLPDKKWVSEVPCPYWTSVGYALLGYLAHRVHENALYAMNAVMKMTTRDWQIECFRWLASRRYGEHSYFVKAVIDTIATYNIGSLAKAQAVFAYIFQDQPEVLTEWTTGA